MGGDDDKKRELLRARWHEFQSRPSVRLLHRCDAVDRLAYLARMTVMPGGCPPMPESSCASAVEHPFDCGCLDATEIVESCSTHLEARGHNPGVCGVRPSKFRRGPHARDLTGMSAITPSSSCSHLPIRGFA